MKNGFLSYKGWQFLIMSAVAIQALKLQPRMPRFADSVSVGETVPVSFQVMNMGRSAMYNVRCTVSGYGLVPSNTGYIGTMEAVQFQNYRKSSVEG